MQEKLDLSFLEDGLWSIMAVTNFLTRTKKETQNRESTYFDYKIRREIKEFF